jgi:hypothetical protein
MTSKDVSRRESGQLAVASATLGPWKAAGVTGVIGGAAALGVDVVTMHWSTSLLAGPVGLALFLFFLVGGVGSVLGRSGGDQRLRRWAHEHPWQVALAPAGGFFVTDVLTHVFLSSSGLFASIWTGIWQAVILAAVVGVVGSVAGARRRKG